MLGNLPNPHRAQHYGCYWLLATATAAAAAPKRTIPWPVATIFPYRIVLPTGQGFEEPSSEFKQISTLLLLGEVGAHALRFVVRTVRKVGVGYRVLLCKALFGVIASSWSHSGRWGYNQPESRAESPLTGGLLYPYLFSASAGSDCRAGPFGCDITFVVAGFPDRW